MNPPGIPDRVISFIGLVPSTLFVFGSSFLILHELLQSIGKNQISILYLSLILFLSAFIIWLVNLLWSQIKIFCLRTEYPIKDVSCNYHLLWVDDTGFLVEIKRNKAILRWIASWNTASDLKFLGYRNIFRTKKEDGETIYKVLDKLLKEKFNIDDWSFGKELHTTGAPGS